MYYAELNVPKNHVYLFKPQGATLANVDAEVRKVV